MARKNKGDGGIDDGYLPVRPRPRKRAEESTKQLRHSPRRKWEWKGMSWLRNPLPPCRNQCRKRSPTQMEGGRSWPWERCLSRIYFPFWSKNLGVVAVAAASDVVVISGDPHPSICKRGEREREERGCRSTTTTTFLPLWGAEIGQWLGKHVPSLLFHSLSLSDPTLSHFYSPFPRSQK